ncbi:hypothetical protein ABZU32_22710 [Sphaerisporangium sp. NPDC005288]|uniref:hypothetical protein n=1 Tax=Sphaerisporangium sp. NPDC005288 TaxID=3155114 RepID=UPI0033B54014
MRSSCSQMLHHIMPVVAAGVCLALSPIPAAVAGTVYTTKDGAIPSPNEGKDELGAGAG